MRSLLSLCTIIVMFFTSRAQDYNKVWEHNFNSGSQDANHEANQICYSPVNGNRYVLGVHENNPILICYSASGQLIWDKKFYFSGASFNNNYVIEKLNQDASGNIYLSALVHDYLLIYKLVVIKLNPLGTVQWQITDDIYFNNSGLSVAFDSMNHLYITTTSSIYSQGAWTYDSKLYKINTSGNVVWRKSLDSLTGKDLRTDKVLLDNANNPVILSKELSGKDYNLSSVDPSGNMLWSFNYTDTTNSDDVPVDFNMDATGNFLITGTSYCTQNSKNVFIVKCLPNGNLIWKKRINCGINPSIKKQLLNSYNGNEYIITSPRDNSNKYYLNILQISSSGNLLDSVCYLGVPGLSTIPYDAMVDLQGNILITGGERMDQGPYTDGQIFTIKYQPNLSLSWKRILDLSNKNDFGLSVTTDNSGNVYITGTELYYRKKIFILEYSNQGVLSRQKIYEKPGHKKDLDSLMVIDNAGNIYLSGLSNDSLIIYKLNNSGVELWRKQFDCYQCAHSCRSMQLDSIGNLILTGIKYYNDTLFVKSINGLTGATNWDYYYTDLLLTAYKSKLSIGENNSIYCIAATYNTCRIFKLNSAGILLWEKDLFDSIANRKIVPYNITYQKSTNQVIVTGGIQGVQGLLPAGYNGSAVLKFDLSGNEIWRRVDSVSNSGYSYMIQHSLDSIGNIYYLTYNIDLTGNYIETFKLSAMGSVLWSTSHNIPNSDLEPTDIQTDHLGFPVIIGNKMSIAGGQQLFVLKYDSNGNQMFFNLFGNQHYPDANASALAIGPENEIIASGYVTTNNATDYLTLIYDSYGIISDTLWYDNDQNNIDQITCSGIDPFGNIIVCGNSYLDGNYDITTLKYSKYEFAGTKELSKIKNQSLMIYPNPSTESFFIHLHSDEVIKKLKILNSSGSVVMNELINQKKTSVSVESLSGGLYLIEVIGDDNRIYHEKIIVSH